MHDRTCVGRGRRTIIFPGLHCHAIVWDVRNTADVIDRVPPRAGCRCAGDTEEALEGEVADALGRERYEGEKGGYRNGCEASVNRMTFITAEG